MRLFDATDESNPGIKLLFGIAGVGLLLLLWILLTSGPTPVMHPVTLPSPLRVLIAFSALLSENHLISNVGFSIGLNLSGYFEAILIAIPVGFIIGLIKWARWGFHRPVDAIRYIPLTALLGLFIAWFGIGAPMKIHFLAFGILIYILPIIVQRIDEVDDVYLKTVHTLGASDWQILKSVYIPSVLSRLSDDLRVLTAISWTYIIVAEGIASQGGIGNLIWAVQRQGRTDKVFALLIIIMVIGVIQDKVFVWLDRELFPHKYQASDSIKASTLKQKSIVRVIIGFALQALGWIALSIYFILMINEFVGFVDDFKPLTYLFGETVWVIHLIVTGLLLYKFWKWYRMRNDMMALQAVKTQSGGS